MFNGTINYYNIHSYNRKLIILKLNAHIQTFEIIIEIAKAQIVMT